MVEIEILPPVLIRRLHIDSSARGTICMSLEVVMHHEEPQAKHGPSYSQGWSAYDAQCFPQESRGLGAQHQQQQHVFAPVSSSPSWAGERPELKQPEASATASSEHVKTAPGEAAPTTLKRHRPDTPTSTPKASPTKAKRVRTGCLTCRERHLKCDEAVPDCMNCRKRGRECKRGIRLNFLDINVHRPVCVAPLEEWTGMLLDIVACLGVLLRPLFLIKLTP